MTNKAKQILARKKAYCGPLLQAVVSKTLRFFYKIFFSLQNIVTLNKSASAEIIGGGVIIAPPPGCFLLAKGPGP